MVNVTDTDVNLKSVKTNVNNFYAKSLYIHCHNLMQKVSPSSEEGKETIKKAG